MLRKTLEFILNEYGGILDSDYVDYLFTKHNIGDCTITELMQLAHEYEIYVRGL